MTGGRLARLRDQVGDETFMMTYGDGLADIDFNALVSHHRHFGGIATVTAVRPPARFGSLVLDDSDNVTSFEEKISGSEALINGGFFVLEPNVFDYVGDDTVPFESEPMERLAQKSSTQPNSISSSSATSGGPMSSVKCCCTAACSRRPSLP